MVIQPLSLNSSTIHPLDVIGSIIVIAVPNRHCNARYQSTYHVYDETSMNLFLRDWRLPQHKQ